MKVESSGLILKTNENESLSNVAFLSITLIGLLLTFLFRANDSSNLFFYTSILIGFSILYSVVFIPLKYTIYPLVVAIVSMVDMTQTSQEIESVGVKVAATPWQFTLGPITPSIVIFGALLIVLLRLLKIKKKNPYNIVFFYFLVVQTLISIFWGFPFQSVSRFITDAKVPMFFCLGIVIFDSYFNRFPNSTKTVGQVFFALLIGYFCVDVFKMIFGENVDVTNSGYENLSLDSGKGLILIIIYYAIIKVYDRKNILLNLCVVLIGTYTLIAYQTRWLILMLVAGLIVIGSFIGLGKLTKILIPLGIFFVIATPLLISLFPDVWRVMLLRFNFVENIGQGGGLEEVDIIRAGSIFNSFNTLLDKYSIFNGMGYGSWYTDKYFPMTNIHQSAFDQESINTRRFYRIHDFTFQFLFKFGIIGLLLYFNAFTKPIKKLWKHKAFILNSPQLKYQVIILFGITPMAITYMWFTGKGLLFCALLITFMHQVSKNLILTQKSISNK